jgi:hypothetical protein
MPQGAWAGENRPFFIQTAADTALRQRGDTFRVRRGWTDFRLAAPLTILSSYNMLINYGKTWGGGYYFWRYR